MGIEVRVVRLVQLAIHLNFISEAHSEHLDLVRRACAERLAESHVGSMGDHKLLIDDHSVVQFIVVHDDAALRKLKGTVADFS